LITIFILIALSYGFRLHCFYGFKVTLSVNDDGGKRRKRRGGREGEERGEASSLSYIITRLTTYLEMSSLIERRWKLLTGNLM
jgi:hypothetical protein